MSAPRAYSCGGRRRTGQGGIEVCLWVLAFSTALVALNHYVRFGMAGRVKQGADSISQTLFNSADAEVAFLRCQDSVDVRRGAAGAGRLRFGSLARDRTDLTEPVARFALSECPDDLLPPESVVP